MPSRSQPWTRRRLLEATTGLTIAILAGCLSRPNPGNPDFPVPEETTSTMNSTSQADREARRESSSWPQFGHDTRNTGYTPDGTGPSENSEIAWRFDAGTPTMNTSPVAVDGTVYVLGSGAPGYIHAVDIVTGEAQGPFEPAGYAPSAPAIVGNTLYIGTWGKQFYALDTTTGEPRWTKDIGHRFGSSSSIVADGTVYVGTIGDGPLRVSGSEDGVESASGRPTSRRTRAPPRRSLMNWSSLGAGMASLRLPRMVTMLGGSISRVNVRMART